MPVRHTTRLGLDTFEVTNTHALAEVCPARGGLVTRFQAAGDEVLYLDEATLKDPAKNVRGGVPLLFPVAGPPPPGSPLKQHGFARNLNWAAAPDGEVLRLTLEPSELTRSMFPFEFRVEYAIELVGARLELRWLVHNRDAKPMPLHFGLHPYFRVPLTSKARASVQTAATSAWDNRAKRVGPAGPIDFGGEELDLHLLDHGRQGTVLDRGDGTEVPLQWSHSFETLVLWTLPGAAFVCVEPWSAPSQAARAALGRPPVTLPAGGSSSFAFTIGR